MTKLQSGEVEIEFLEPYACEGCGEEVDALIEDDGMNWLCLKCFLADEDGESHECNQAESDAVAAEIGSKQTRRLST